MTSLPPSATLDGSVKEKKPKQHRQRVPLLCLNCKKRKVKCDKARPSCGGCVRNNVAHLCVYKDPPWLQIQVASTTPDSEESSPSNTRSCQSSSLHSLNQQRQIEELKSQLRFWQSLPSFLYLPVTFLHRLCPPEIHNTLLLKIDENEGYRVSISSSHEKRAEFFSWISIIKLDPQLEALWSKITKLLTVYHNYKASLRNKGTKVHARAPRKLPKGITEIDFTVATNSAAINKPLCPVIECDFVFTSGDKKSQFENESVSTSSSSRTPSITSNSPEPTRLLSELVDMVWINTVELEHGHQLNHQQVYFLIEYYFNKPHQCQSRNMLAFYKKEILDSVRRDGSMVKSNVGSSSANTLSRCSVYLCMLSIIIHGSLEELQSGSRLNSDCKKFTSLFPPGVNLRDSTDRDWITTVHTLLLGLSTEWHTSLAYVAAQIGLLNSIISIRKRQHDGPRTRIVFTSALKLLLEIVGRNGLVDASKDPELVQAAGNVYSRRNTQLKLHICYVWASLVRLSNLASLDWVPLVNHSAEIDLLLHAIAVKIEAAKTDNFHSKFLVKHGGPQSLQNLLTTSYLISEIVLTLNRASMNHGSPRLLVSHVCKMRQHCEEWLALNVEPALNTDCFKQVCAVSFLNCYLNYVLLLHGEDTAEENVIMACVPKIFTSLLGFLEFIRSCVRGFQSPFPEHYTILAVVEMLARLVQFVMGLLMRIHNQDTAQTYTLLRDTIRKHNVQVRPCAVSPVEVDVQSFVEIQLVEFVNSILDMLNTCECVDQGYYDKLSKMWRFYLTFVNNSRKMLSVDYAKIHSNVPVFKSEPLNIRGCPVFQSDGTPKSARGGGKPSEFRRCPILHIMSPMTLDNEREVRGMGSIPPPLTADRRNTNSKRECPFDGHSSTKKTQATCPFPNADTTSISLSTKPPTVCPVSHGTSNSADALPVGQPQEPFRNNSQVDPSTTPPSFPDLLSFMEHNLDFDFLQNDVLMEQMSLVNDLDVRGPFVAWST